MHTSVVLGCWQECERVLGLPRVVWLCLLGSSSLHAISFNSTGFLLELEHVFASAALLMDKLLNTAI